MKIAIMLLIALLVGLSAVTWTTEASAAGRNATMKRCTAQAQRQFPRVSRPGNQDNRTRSFKACMASAGFRP
jgi:hypothetical protein